MTYFNKQTQIGKIPEDWEVVELEEFIELETGKRVRGGGLNEGTVPSIGGEHVNRSGNIIWNNLKFIPEDFYNNLTQGKIRINDVLIVKDGATTGKVAFVKNLSYSKVAVNEHVFIVRSKLKSLLNEFLFYVMFSNIGQTQIKLNFHGMIGGIKRGEVKSLRIPLPPLPEQQKIAEILTTADEALEKVDEAIEKTQRLKKGLMQKLLTKGIGHKEFKNTEIGRIPKKWEVVEINEVVHINKELRDPAKEFPDKKFLYIDIDSVENEAGVIRSAKTILGSEAPSRARRLIHYNNVILSTVRPYLKAFAIVPREYDDQICSTGFAVFACKERILPLYLLYTLFSNPVIEQCNRMMVGGQYPALNNSQVEKIIIPLPPLPEQQKIAEILSTVDKRLELLRERKERLERIKKGLMNDLLTGKRKVKNEYEESQDG